MQLLGLDSGRYSRPREVREAVLATGNRADLSRATNRGDCLRCSLHSHESLNRVAPSLLYGRKASLRL